MVELGIKDELVDKVLDLRLKRLYVLEVISEERPTLMAVRREKISTDFL
jgi:hypothetical protein